MLLKILKNMTYVLFNGGYLIGREHEVAMAPAFRPVCFLNVALFLFIVKELTVFNERIV